MVPNLLVFLIYNAFALVFTQRLQFDVTSPNGILLFREASKIINCYGDHILTLSDIPDDKLYTLKYPLVFLPLFDS